MLQPKHLRAVLRHQENQETLLLSLDFVESGTIVGEKRSNPLAKEFTWVLPIPQDSSDMRECSSIPMRMLIPITGPHKVNSRIIDFFFVPFLLLGVALFVWCCMWQTRHRWAWLKKALWALIVVSVILFLGILLIAGITPSPMAVVGLWADDLVATSMAEPLQAVILRPQSLEEFREVLAREHHLEMAEPHVSRVASYIDHGWAFGVIRITMSELSSNIRTPSMAFTFTTQTPILPLPLFDAGCGPVSMDAVVIGETGFQSDTLRLESSFLCHEKSHTVAQLHDENVPISRLGACSAYTLEGLPNLWIAFPAITELLWDGCVLTRFSGEVAPDKDLREIVLHPKSSSASFRVSIGNPWIIFLKSMFYASLMGLAWMTGIVLLLHFSKAKGHRGLMTVLTLCVIPISVGAGIAYCSRVQSVDGCPHSWGRNMPTDYLDVLVENLSEDSASSGAAVHADMHAKVDEILREAMMPQECEEDWRQLFEDDRGLVCRVYDVRDDRPVEVERMTRATPYFGPVPRANNKVWPRPDPTLTFIGEPTDIVLVEKSSPQ